MQHDIAVLGSGGWGSSIAFHLASRGRDVVLIDRHAPASQTSPRAAGLGGQLRGNPTMTAIAVEAVEGIRRFTEATGAPLDHHQTGSVKVARREEDVALVAREVAHAEALGLESHRLDPEDVPRLVPYATATSVLAAAHTPTDVYFDPTQLAAGYVAGLRGLGVEVMAPTRRSEIVTAEGRVVGVQTDRGLIETSVVVDAAGAWTRDLATAIGVRVPLVPVRHQLMVTEPIPGVDSTQPSLRVIDAQVYVRPDRGGLMVGGYEIDPTPVDLGTAPPDFQVADLEPAADVLDALVRRVVDVVPALRDPAVRERRVGLPTMTPDGLPIVGPINALDGLFVASGCCVGGLSLSPSIGALVAEWVDLGTPHLDLSDLSPARFETAWTDDDEVLAAALRQYSDHYITHR